MPNQEDEVRLAKPRPLQLWVTTLDGNLNEDHQAFEFKQRNREILFLGFVLLLVWTMTHLLYSSYEEIRTLNVTIAEKDRVIAAMPSADAIAQKIKEELKPKPEEKPAEDKKTKGKKRKAKPMPIGQSDSVAGGTMFGRQ